MSKGVIAALLILALGKPWCCCAFPSAESASATNSDSPPSCCHPGKASPPRPAQPEDRSCKCHGSDRLLPTGLAVLKAPERTDKGTPEFAFPATGRGTSIQFASTPGKAPGPPPGAPPPLYLLHVALRC